MGGNTRRGTQKYSLGYLLMILKLKDQNRLVNLPYVATPGARHVPEVYIKSLRPTDVESDKVVINEVRNDTSRANIDWVELKNTSSRAVDLEEWELSIVTNVGQDESSCGPTAV